MANNRIFSSAVFTRPLCFLALLFLAEAAFGQVKPEYFPDDIDANVSSAQIRCMCKPGVRNKSRSRGLEISYDLVGGGTYTPESGGQQAPYSKFKRWQNLNVDLRVPVLNKPGLKFLVGYRYIAESVKFQSFGADHVETYQTLDRKLLQSNSLSFMFSKSLNENEYLLIRFRNSVNGNYSGLQLYNQRYNIHKALAMYGKKPNEDFEWGIGLNFSKGFRNRTSLLPFVLYNRNFNDKWAIESALPAFVFVRRNLNEKTLLLGGLEYSGQSYRLDVDGASPPLDYAYNHSEILASVQMERHISQWIWLNIKVGYQYNLSSDFESKSAASPEFKVEPSHAPFIRIGLFLSPPEHLIK